MRRLAMPAGLVAAPAAVVIGLASLGDFDPLQTTVLAALGAGVCLGAVWWWRSPLAKEDRGRLGRDLFMGAGVALALLWVQLGFERNIQELEDQRERQFQAEQRASVQQEARRTLQLTLGQRQRLRGIDLSGRDLRRFYLAGKDLTDANLVGADLRGASLEDAILRRAELHDADLRGANLAGADLRGAWLGEAPRIVEEYVRPQEAQFIGRGGVDARGADFFDADLRGAHLQRARLDGAYLDSARLVGARLRRASLREADLFETSLRRADLRGVDLRKAVLTAADLTAAKLSGIDTRMALWDFATSFPSSVLACRRAPSAAERGDVFPPQPFLPGTVAVRRPRTHGPNDLGWPPATPKRELERPRQRLSFSRLAFRCVTYERMRAEGHGPVGHGPISDWRVFRAAAYR